MSDLGSNKQWKHPTGHSWGLAYRCVAASASWPRGPVARQHAARLMAPSLNTCTVTA